MRRPALRAAAAGSVIAALAIAVAGQGGATLSSDCSRPNPALPLEGEGNKGQKTLSVRDFRGVEFRVPPAPPSRIVSLAPNVTEILFRLGLGDRVAADTRFCDYPPEAAAKPKVGGLVDLSYERIQAARPDLVIAFRGNPLRSVERLAKLGLPVFVLDIGRTLDALFPMIEAIGAVTGRVGEASALAAALRERAAGVRARVAGAARRPRAFVLLHGRSLWTCGRGSYLHDLLGVAGAVNAAGASDETWLFYGRERLLRDDPDVVLVLARSAADFEDTKAWLRSDPGLAGLRAAREGRIYRLDEDRASRFGPRLLDTLDELASLLHPEAFPPGAAPAGGASARRAR